MEALTKQNCVRLLGKLKKSLKKKLKQTYLPKFLQEEIGNPHIFFWPNARHFCSIFLFLNKIVLNSLGMILHPAQSLSFPEINLKFQGFQGFFNKNPGFSRTSWQFETSVSVKLPCK